MNTALCVASSHSLGYVSARARVSFNLCCYIIARAAFFLLDDSWCTIIQVFSLDKTMLIPHPVPTLHHSRPAAAPPQAPPSSFRQHIVDHAEMLHDRSRSLIDLEPGKVVLHGFSRPVGNVAALRMLLLHLHRLLPHFCCTLLLLLLALVSLTDWFDQFSVPVFLISCAFALRSLLTSFVPLFVRQEKATTGLYRVCFA